MDTNAKWSVVKPPPPFQIRDSNRFIYLITCKKKSFYLIYNQVQIQNFYKKTLFNISMPVNQ